MVKIKSSPKILILVALLLIGASSVFFAFGSDEATDLDTIKASREEALVEELNESMDVANNENEILNEVVETVEDVPDKVQAFLNIPYGSDTDVTEQSLDLYVPSDATSSHPLLIWIHGGDFATGDKSEVPILDTSRLGYAVASINYRLAPSAKHPDQIHDVKDAISFLRENSSKYNIDVSKIAVMGESAGGYLAALAGVSCGVEELSSANSDLEGSCVDAVVSSAAPYDSKSLFYQANESGQDVTYVESIAEFHLCGETVCHGLKQEGLDVVKYLDDVARETKFHIQYGAQDKSIPIQQSIEFHEALLDNEINSKIERIESGEHQFVLSESVLNFLDDEVR